MAKKPRRKPLTALQEMELQTPILDALSVYFLNAYEEGTPFGSVGTIGQLSDSDDVVAFIAYKMTPKETPSAIRLLSLMDKQLAEVIDSTPVSECPGELKRAMDDLAKRHKKSVVVRRLSSDAVEAIANAAYRIDVEPGLTWTQKRDYTITMLLYQTGLHISELCQLRWYDLLPAHDPFYLSIRKSKNVVGHRQVKLSGDAISKISDWVTDNTEHEFKDSDPIFSTGPETQVAMTPKLFKKRFKTMVSKVRQREPNLLPEHVEVSDLRRAHMHNLR